MTEDPRGNRTLSWTAARRIALRAQGIGGSRRTEAPDTATSRRALVRTLERTHLLQIDSVSVFARAHHLPVYTRHGRWDPAALDRASRPGRSRLVSESFAHEAAFVTDEVQHLLHFRRRTVSERDWGALREVAVSSPHLFPRIHEALAEIGPAGAAAISRHLGDTERPDGWGWRRTRTQWAVEYLFRTGALDCVGRSAQFERLYVSAASEAGVGEGAGPPADAPTEEESIAALTALALRALGIAEPATVADYFRLPVLRVRPVLEAMVARGEAREVEVAHPAGVRTMLLHPEAPGASPVRGSALVSPFDPLVFHRPRLEALFDLEYRLGIYTPAPRRTIGYYSLLFLHGDVFPALVDLGADRARSVLEVRGAFRPPLPHLPARSRPDQEQMLEALACELELAARWQGLASVEVRTGAGTRELAGPLAAVLARR